jgi:quercetin 2,3-dioxygenase
MAQTAVRPAECQPIAQVLAPEEQHWVGNGFFVSTIFSPHQVDPQLISPFLLMDHAPPKRFAPGATRRGVGEHPHRGFETVTFAYEGEIEHRDSHGGGGRIGPGDIQWMTAASGVVHEEFHSREFHSGDDHPRLRGPGSRARAGTNEGRRA